MAEAKETAGKDKKPKKKDTLPTNCAQTNARIRRKNWYYRNGQYFSSKAAAKAYAVKKADEKSKAAAAAEKEKAEKTEQAAS